MFLRKKKVGSSYYFQLVESSRTKNGPRLKIHATLGRADQLEESGKLDKLAENFVKYSSNTLLLSKSKPADAMRVPAHALQDLVIRRLLAIHRLDQPVKSFIAGTSTPADLRAALRQALFERGVVNSPRVLKSVLDMAGHAEAVAGLIADECEPDQRLFIYVEKQPTRRLTLLGGSITATAVNASGRVLMVAHWLEYLQFPEMLRHHVDHFRSVLDKDQVVIVLGRSLLNPRMVAHFAASRIPFVVPLHEPSALLDAEPSQVFEEKPETPPFEDVRNLRYVRAVDNHVAMKERQIREFQQTRIRRLMSDNQMHARMHHEALARMGQVARFDGTTLLATNLEDATPRDILQAYLAGQRGRRFQLQASRYLAELSMSPDLPRDIEPLLAGGLTLQLLATYLADRLAEIVSEQSGAEVDWPQVAFILNHELPLILGEGQADLLAIPTDSLVLKAVLDALSIDEKALVKSARRAGPRANGARQRIERSHPADAGEEEHF
jgi:hypothetical protein